MDENGWKWMSVDESGLNGWKWIKWMNVDKMDDENGCKWMKMDESGWNKLSNVRRRKYFGTHFRAQPICDNYSALVCMEQFSRSMS